MGINILLINAVKGNFDLSCQIYWFQQQSVLKLRQYSSDENCGTTAIIKNKEKKIKPMKQPVKLARPPTLLDKVVKIEDSMGVKDREKQSRQAPHMAQSVSEQRKNITRESICTQLLQTGNVQSFIDLFYISHKCLPNLIEEEQYFGDSIHIPDLPLEEQSTLQFYSEFATRLSKAEVHLDSTMEEKEAAMNEYHSIAYNYEDQGNYVTACYFYQKVIDLALSCKNQQFELTARLGLGKCHDQMKKHEKAIQILEEAFDTACTLQEKDQRGEMMHLIGKELIQIYIQKAEQEVKFDLEQALKAFQCGLTVSQRAGQRESQARISHKIGELYYMENQFQKSIDYQEQYLQKLQLIIEDQMAREAEEGGTEKKDSQNSLKFKQMEAHASLAKCYLKLKKIEQAEKHLNDYHRMAKQAKAQNSVADSSYYLGKLFQEKGQRDKAIIYYQSYFQAAKSEKSDRKDRKLVDRARVTFAIAKANKNMEKYIGLFQGQDSLKNVLDWKIKRVLK